MPRRTDGGSALVEFLGLGILLGAPLVYVLVALSQFQAAAMAAVTVSEQIARIHAEAPDAAEARVRDASATREMAGDYGIDPAVVHVNVTCDGRCPGPGVLVTAHVTIDVPLPLMPSSSRIGHVKGEASVRSPKYG